MTGMGVIAPLGHSVEQLYRSQIEGQSGVTCINLFDASHFPTTFAAQVKDFDLGRFVKDPTRWRDSGANSRFAAAAAQQALGDANLLDSSGSSGVDRTRVGVYLGSGEGIQDFQNLTSLVARTYSSESREVDAVRFVTGGLREFHRGREFEQEPHTTPAHLAEYFDLEGPNYNCLTACAASSQAIGEATELIRRGDADVMLTGGAHSMIHPLGITGFNLLTALSTRNDSPATASRPFDLNRDGFVLGEGAGMLVLEELEHAKKRNAPIYGEVSGYGTTADAFRLTDSHPEGRGAIACIRMALEDSQLTPQDIGYINAHGTSTQVNDRVETMAIKQAFGEHARAVPVSSSKSMLGHLIAAAGAVELIITVMALNRGVLPPTINYEVADPDCDLDYIPNVAREKRVEHALSNSFGFGGQNVSLVVSRFTN
jgi:3-oxoacyl-[acyl-carrier-protein] synthase II